MKRQSVLGGSMLLIASAIATKLLGAMFKIPLTSMLGGEGMGYFSSAYGLFLPIFSLSVIGINTAIAALTAKLLAKKDDAAAWLLYQKSMRLFCAIGVLGSVLLYCTAEPLCTHFLKNPGALPAVRCFSPAIFFCCVNAVFRGVWEGRQDMYPTALSQGIESAARLLGGLLFCHIAQRGFIFIPGISPTQATAAAAILGVTASTAVGTLLLMCFRIPKPQQGAKPLSDSKALLPALAKILLPISAAALITNLTSIVDLATGIRGLEQLLSRQPDFLSGFHSSKEAANFLYGAFTGMSVTLFNLVPSITNMLGKGVLPAFSTSYAEQNSADMSRHASSALQASAFLSIPAGLGIFVLAKPILMMLFPTRPEEVAVAAEPLMLLGLAVIPLSLSIPLMSMLQAADAALQSALVTLAGVGVKLLSNLILIPKIGLMGMAVSTFLCYLVILVLAAGSFRRKTAILSRLLRLMIKPMLSGSFCAVGASASYALLIRSLPQPISLLLAIITGGSIYLLTMWCLCAPKKASA